MSEPGKQELPSVNPEFWVKRWDDGQIGWHKDFVDVMLQVILHCMLLSSINFTIMFDFHALPTEILLLPVWREGEPWAISVSSTLWEVLGPCVAV